MNRGITLCIPEPDLNDLILTANSIAKDIDEQIGEIPREVINNLAKSYYEYKKYLEKYYPEYYDIHGARDYYNLIKISVGRFKNNCGRTLENFAIESIERNFSGIELDKEQNNTTMASSTKFKQIFLNFQNNAVENIYNYNIFSCIENNLKDNNRYLLLITDNTKNSSLIELILKMLHLNFKFIQGSKLKEDQTEDYVLKKAWSIISSMEKGETIVLKDLETLYPKFYDLFNKNLITIGNEQFARIVLDSNTNERHIVNKNFKCLVSLDKDELLKEDPPFLNRFEKHLISFKYLLNEYQNGLSHNIYKELIEMTSLLQKDKSPLLLNINKEEIRCLILDLSLKNVPNNENINLLSEKIAPLFSQENILNISYSPKRKYFSKDNLLKIYEKESHSNFKDFLKDLNRLKVLIYTFSPFNKDIFSFDEIKIENKIFGEFCKANTLEIFFNEELSENILNYFFQQYFETKNLNLFITHFNLENVNYLQYYKYLLDNFITINDKLYNNKVIIFIIHINKNINVKSSHFLKIYSNSLPLISDFYQITIDNLFIYRKFSVVSLVNKENNELLQELIDLKSIVLETFSKEINNMFSEDSPDSRINKVKNIIDNGIYSEVEKKIKIDVKYSDNLLKLFLRKYTQSNDKEYDDFMSYFLDEFKNHIANRVSILIKGLKKKGYLISTILEEKKENIPDTFNKVTQNIIMSYTEEHNEYNEYNYFDFKIPGITSFYDRLMSLIKENCKFDYLNIEKEYRKKKSILINLEVWKKYITKKKNF